VVLLIVDLAEELLGILEEEELEDDLVEDELEVVLEDELKDVLVEDELEAGLVEDELEDVLVEDELGVVLEDELKDVLVEDELEAGLVEDELEDVLVEGELEDVLEEDALEDDPVEVILDREEDPVDGGRGELDETVDEELLSPRAKRPPPFQLPPQMPLPGLSIAWKVPPNSSPMYVTSLRGVPLSKSKIAMSVVGSIGVAEFSVYEE
jgi:hypothetical protein